jgi:hypothetical protein
MFPKVYRNREGPRDNPTRNFEDWEIQRTQDPTDASDMQLYEYPVKPLVQGHPFSSEFDFDKEPASLKQCKAPHPNDKVAYRKRWEKPPNDLGPIRPVVNKYGHVVGAIYHPEGDPSTCERARLEPMDAKCRGEVARWKDRELTGRATWPERGPK